MDEAHLMAAFRYVAMNPVRANLVELPEDWKWSSARAHLQGCDDVLVDVQPLLERVNSVAEFLSVDAEPALQQALRQGQSIGRPVDG